MTSSTGGVGPTRKGIIISIAIGVAISFGLTAIVIVVAKNRQGDEATPRPTPASTTSTSPAADAAATAQQAMFPGLVVATGLTSNHANRGERITYPDAAEHPPLGGNHAAIWLNCQVYTAPVPTENAVHSLEHGAVWITYQPTLDAGGVSTLAGLMSTSPKVLVSPREQRSPVTLTAWGRQLDLRTPDVAMIERFLDTFLEGKQAPEPGASCASPVNQPADAPFVYNGPNSAPSISTSTEVVSASGRIG